MYSTLSSTEKMVVYVHPTSSTILVCTSRGKVCNMYDSRDEQKACLAFFKGLWRESEREVTATQSRMWVRFIYKTRVALFGQQLPATLRKHLVQNWRPMK